MRHRNKNPGQLAGIFFAGFPACPLLQRCLLWIDQDPVICLQGKGAINIPFNPR